VEGWKLFCERLEAPPLLLWQGYPGFQRVQHALELAERVAFVPEGFLCWLNRTRPPGHSPRSEVPLTAESVADATEQVFRRRVECTNEAPCVTESKAGTAQLAKTRAKKSRMP
jgi:hypothetical protein